MSLTGPRRLSNAAFGFRTFLRAVPPAGGHVSNGIPVATRKQNVSSRLLRMDSVGHFHSMFALEQRQSWDR